MIYCFIDESGNPSTKDSEPFYVAMVFLASLDKVNEIKEKIRELKKKIIAKIAQEKSKNNDLIQVADYIAGAASSNIKIK